MAVAGLQKGSPKSGIVENWRTFIRGIQLLHQAAILPRRSVAPQSPVLCSVHCGASQMETVEAQLLRTTEETTSDDEDEEETSLAKSSAQRMVGPACGNVAPKVHHLHLEVQTNPISADEAETADKQA